VAHHGSNLVEAQRPDQPDHVPDQVQDPVGMKVAVVVAVPAGGSAVAALVRGDHVKTGRRERQHDLAPAVGKFGKTVQQDDAGPPAGSCGREAGFQQVHRQAVHVPHEPGSDTGRQDGGFERLGHGGSWSQGKLQA
jgi:hypothetical protein